MRAPTRRNLSGRRARLAESADAAPYGGIAAMDDPHSLHALLTLCATYLSPDDLALIYRAYKTAAIAHEGVTRASGEPYIEHPLAVATILAELAIDGAGIAAALL